MPSNQWVNRDLANLQIPEVSMPFWEGCLGRLIPRQPCETCLGFPMVSIRDMYLFILDNSDVYDFWWVPFVKNYHHHHHPQPCISLVPSSEFPGRQCFFSEMKSSSSLVCSFMVRKKNKQRQFSSSHLQHIFCFDDIFHVKNLQQNNFKYL